LTQEFVIGGYNPEGNKFSSLLVGYYDAAQLIFAGKVRQGFNSTSRLTLMKTLKPLTGERCPFAAGVIKCDEIRNEQCSRRTQPLVKSREHLLPLSIIAQMMEHLTSKDDVERAWSKGEQAHIALDCLHFAGSRRFHSALGTFQHGPTQIDQNTIQWAHSAKDAKSEIAGPATQIEKHSSRPDMTRRRARDHV
jgi:hypothetical protein